MIDTETQFNTFLDDIRTGKPLDMTGVAYWITCENLFDDSLDRSENLQRLSGRITSAMAESTKVRD